MSSLNCNYILSHFHKYAQNWTFRRNLPFLLHIFSSSYANHMKYLNTMFNNDEWLLIEGEVFKPLNFYYNRHRNTCHVHTHRYMCYHQIFCQTFTWWYVKLIPLHCKISRAINLKITSNLHCASNMRQTNTLGR